MQTANNRKKISELKCQDSLMYFLIIFKKTKNKQTYKTFRYNTLPCTYCKLQPTVALST